MQNMVMENAFLGMRNNAISKFAANSYIPILTNIANISNSIAHKCQYLRLNNMILLSGKATINPALTLVDTQLGISLPIVSNFLANEDCAGVAFSPIISGQGAAMLADIENNQMIMRWKASDITNQDMYFIAMYNII